MFSKVCDHSCKLIIVIVVEKLQQRHCPVKPGVDDFFFLRFVSQNEVVHCRNVTTMSDCDCLSRFDHQRGESSGLGADLVGSNGTDRVDDPCVVTQTVDFLLGVVNVEFAIGLDQCCTPKVEGAKAVLNDVGLEYGSSFAEKHLTQTFAVCQIGSGKCLEGLSVTDGDEVRFSDIWNDGNV